MLARRAQIKLAADGAQLLQGKREALLKELLERARELMGLRKELNRRGRLAVAALALARAVRGTPAVRSAGVAGRRTLHAKVVEQKVWGLPLVDVQHEGIVRERGERALGQLDLSAHTTEAIGSSEQLLEQLIECAPAEANLRILGEEIKKVSRRINALEEQLLPRLRSDVSRIQAVLEERQREDVFRMKRYKKRKEALAKAKTQAGGED